MTGYLRLKRIVLAPRGTFVTGVFAGELREPDGTLIGRESKRATVAAELVRDDTGLHPRVRPFLLDMLGIEVQVQPFAIETSRAFPPAGNRLARSTNRTRASEPQVDRR